MIEKKTAPEIEPLLLKPPQAAKALIDGKPITIGLNAYVRKDAGEIVLAQLA